MTKSLSAEATRKKARKTPKKTIILDEDCFYLLSWLQHTGVNTSEFTRLLWKSTPEFREYMAKKEEIRGWIDESLRKDRNE